MLNEGGICLSVKHAKDPRIKIHSRVITERQCVSEEEFERIASLLHLLDDNARLYMALVMYTGMRRGEVLGLCWKDIDPERNEIHVVRNVTYPKKNQGVIGTPKTESGKRTIPIASALLQQLVPPLKITDSLS